MNNEYVTGLHKYLQGQYGSEFKLNEQQFQEKLNNDPKYVNGLYTYLQDQYGSEFTLTPEEFSGKVKKKESSQVGSQKTPPTSGSKPAQSSGKSFAGSIDYLEPTPKFGEIPTAPKVPGTETVVPAQKTTKKPETPKRTIVRGEEVDKAIAESLKPQQAVSESTKPVVTPPAPMTVEEGELQKVIEKEKAKQPEFIDFQDIEKLYSDPENETSKYYEMFLQNAKNSQKGDIEYGKRLRDAYAADFVDAEFENEYRISSDIDNLTQKMKSELASLSEKAKTDPNAANLFESKKNEYFALISKKQNELDAAREQTNQGYKNRIAEIDKLFQTGEAVLREEGLLDEKRELQRRMGIIELAKNPGSLKDNIGQVQYNKLPGATAQDKLINYLNSRLTAYDRFYNANKEADSLPQEMRNKIKDSYSKLQGELKDLYYLTSLKRFVNPEDRPGFWEATGEKFAKEFLAGGLDFTDNAQMHSENLQTIAKNAGISFSDKDKSYIETTAAPADAYSSEWWGDNFGSTLGFGANIAITAPFGNASLKIGEGIVKATPMFRKIAEYGLKRYSKLGSTGQKITNTIFNSLDEGYNFEMANQLIYDGESDELTFLTGVGGAIAAAPINKLLSKTGKLIFGKADDVTEAVAGKAYTKEEAAALEVLGAQKDDVRMALQGLTKENGVDDYVYMLQGTFGNKASEAIKQIQKVGSVLIARPTGEVAQEMGEELTSIYKQSDSFEAFKQEFSKRFPDADAMTQFVVASYVMGLGFGAGNYVGDVFISQSKKSFDQLPPDQQEIAAEAIREATEDINKADTETINEIELDEASRPKTKEEEEWSAKEGEIKQGIDSNTKRINELDGLKSQIYSNYNITDPKTEDISNISEEDARRLEILNSEIDKADKARIKDEIELELHNKNKPAVEQAPVNAIHAKDLKNKENAIPEPISESVLPRQQGETTETGGEPQGMGQGVQGEEVTQEGQEVAQENELDPDLANIDPLIIAARNGDVDAQNTLNEYGLDWEQTTTYRFVGNSEVETLLSNNRVESKRFVDAGIDVTTSPKVTSASNSEYRITFKESFDVNNGLGKVKVKSREEGDHNLEKGRGYSLEDVAKIERLDENGNVVETLYDAKQKSLEGNQQAAQEGVEQQKAPEVKESVESDNLKDVESTAKALGDKNKEISDVLIPDSSIKQKVYHGSENKIVGDFKNINPNIDGFWFSSDIDNAKTYGENIVEAYVDIKNPLVIDAKGLKFTDDIPVTVIASYPNEAPYETVIPIPLDEIVYMVKNGKRKNQIIEIKDREKYDGVVFKNLIDPSLSSRRNIPQDTIVVFNNTQIKRADNKTISEAYHKAKADGSNPELVNAVEELLGGEQKAPEVQAAEEVVAEEKEPTTEEQTKMEEEAAKSEAMTPKNMKDLIGIYRKVFNLSYPKALVSAMVSNRLINQMAKRAGVTPEQMYQKLQFQKATEQDLPQGVKMQLDAWHASPYLFDKFSSLHQGKGVGASRSGVGLYFAIDKKRAEGYAEKFSDNTLKIGDIEIKEKGVEYSKEFYKNIKQAFDKSNGSRIKFAKELLKIANEKRKEGIIERENFINESLKEGRITQQQIDEYDFDFPNYVEQYFMESSDYRTFARNALKTGVEQNKIPSYLYTVTIKENGNWLDFNKKMTDEQYDAIVNQAKKENSLYLPYILEQGKNKNNRDFYWNVGNSVSQNEKELSNLLMRAGIDGNIGLQDADMVEYVLFDENAVSIKEVIKFQKDAEKARGAMMIGMDGQAIIYALTDANASTPLHELAHVFEHYLTDAEKNQIIKAAKTKGWTTETSEYFARGFENYLATGESSNPIFEKFKQFLLDIYQAIKGSPIDVKLNKQMKDIYAQMVGEDLTEDLGEGIDTNLDKSIIDAVETLANAEEAGGSEITKAQKEVAEKLGEEGEKLVEINRNFDKLAEDLGFIKTCIIE